jgi:hypothetical protein
MRSFAECLIIKDFFTEKLKMPTRGSIDSKAGIFVNFKADQPEELGAAFAELTDGGARWVQSFRTDEGLFAHSL